MTPIRSLRLRFLLAFALFGATLTALYGVVAWESIHLAEDVLVERWLAAEADHFLARRADDPAARPPDGAFVRMATSTTELPEALRGRVEALSEGAHEIGGAHGAKWGLQIRALPGGGRLYVFVNEDALEPSEGLEAPAGAVIAMVSALVALIGVALGLLTTRRIIAPLRRLSEAVSAHAPEGPPPRLRPLVSDDELGALAAHLERAMGRVAESARQEQLFGRYTSHELRSSLAVARGVAELLGDLDDPRLRRPLGRLDRAVDDMGAIIETCLWLARSHGQTPLTESVALRPLADELVARLGERASPQVALSVEIPDGAVIEAPRQAARMVLGNLLTNALRHTVDGTISVVGDGAGIEVRDTGPGIPPDILARVTEPHVRGPGDGHGLGLAIVHGLCVRLGWQLRVESEVGRGTVAVLRWPRPEAEA